MGPVPAELAFEQDEAIDREGGRLKVRVSPQEVVHRFGIAAIPTRQGNVRLEGPVLRLEPRLLNSALNLCRECGDRQLRPDTGPDRATIALFELPDPRNLEIEGWRANPLKRGRNIVRYRPLDFADESEREMQLFVTNPTECGVIVHGVDQKVPDLFRRPYCDEEPVHLFMNVRSDKLFRVRFCLKGSPASTIFRR
jgi:hypothetical protein